MSTDSNTSTRPNTKTKPLSGFLAGFALVAVLLAAGVSYLADSSPDGLEAVTHQGCVSTGEQLRGECIAQSSTEHALAGGPLAGYTVFGEASLTGLAGTIGVAATLAAAGGLFWLLRRRDSGAEQG